MELGLERAGVRTIWHSEIDAFCNQVLAKHWPDIPNLGDVTLIDWSDIERPDILCGGFPCQDISVVGLGAGLSGEHSGLWAHFVRAIRDLRPRYVLVENSPMLLVRGLGDILADLSLLGYDAEWDCLPAAAFGAVHLRARTWLLAYPAGERNGVAAETVRAGRNSFIDSLGWASEPRVCRVHDGVPGRVDRLRSLGNALMPQIAEFIGRQLVRD
jgi:DNA (cytosine-5)-methyltransferase 1